MQALYVVAGIYFGVRVWVHHRSVLRALGGYVFWPVLLLPHFTYLHLRPRRDDD